MKNSSLKVKRNNPVKQRTFSDDEIWEAARIGKYPAGMTAQHLINVGKNKRNSTAASITSRPASRRNRFRAASPLAAYFLEPADEGNWEPNALVRAAVRGVYPRGTTTKDLLVRSRPDPLQFAAMFGHLLPGTKVRELKTNVGHGKSPLWHAMEPMRIEEPNEDELQIGMRNILACPPLAGKLDMGKSSHREILKRVLASPKLTQEIRQKLAKYPQITAFML